MNIPVVSILDIPRCYTALAEWMACMIFAYQQKPRLSRKQAVCVSTAALLIQCLFLWVTDRLFGFLWIVCMLVAVLFMMLHIFLLSDVSWATAAYSCIRCFMVAEFAASLQWQVHCFLWPENNPHLWQRYGLLLAIFAGVYLVIGLLEHRYRSRECCLVTTPNELLITAIIGIAFFAISNLSFYFSGSPFSGHDSSEIMNIRTLVDLGGVAILYAYHIQRSEVQTRKELDAIQTILENQYTQYRLSRDTIDLINRKYHDLKHQISALRSESDPAARNQWLDEMEEDIRAYEAQNKTGNSVLDTLLTSKSLYCQKHSINLTVVADGKHLGFMDVMDICTVFGNALDNAIEYELKLPDKTRRMIHVTLTSQKKFLLLQVENYCPEPPLIRGELPVTTKADSRNHGFGLKSIRYTAQKYGGTSSVSVDNDRFILKVLLPIPPSQF